jgi:predicted nucleic acid-binding protein
MPGTVVIDAGLALKLILPGPEQARLHALVGGWQSDRVRLVAPALWLYEVTSALTKAVHSGALTEDEGRRALGLLIGLEVSLVLPDAAQAGLAYAWTLNLQRAAAYDSFYLALAETLGAELWTTDRRLRAAVDLPWLRSLEPQSS